MQLFKPSISPTFRRQAKALSAAQDLCYLKPAPELNHLLKELEQPADSSVRVKGYWFGSLNAVKELLWQRVVWCSFQSLAILISVAAMQRLLVDLKNTRTLILLCLIVVSAETIKHIIAYYDRLRGANIMRGVQAHLISLVNSKLPDLDSESEQQFSRGNLKTLVSSDVEAIEDFITAASQTWIPTFCMLIILSPIIIYSTGLLGVVGILTALFQVPLTLVFSRIIARIKTGTQDKKDKLTTVMGEWVKNIRLIRFLRLQPKFSDDINLIMRRYTGQAARLHVIDCLMWGLSHNWWMFVLASMLVAGSLLNIPIELNSFLPSCWALLYMTSFFNHIPYSISLYAQATASAERIKSLFAAPELSRHIQPTIGPHLSDGLGEAVRLHISELSKSYADTVVIAPLSTIINLRQRTAIIGTVASGKTTLLEMLCGEIFPSSGEIEIEFSSGVKAPLWSTGGYGAFRAQVAYSPQSPYLSNAQLHQNISLEENADASRLARATNLAQLDQDIATLRQGLNEEVGETGINLSGGQKQRVSLARAFYSKRPIFFLDDPLSAVDSKTEARLMHDICAESRGLIIVSHRLEELHACDRIIVLEAGKICEDGDAKTLLQDANSHVTRYLTALAQKTELNNE
jgi:ABC-type multidrug transport system fused ATPase/permease subunit